MSTCTKVSVDTLESFGSSTMQAIEKDMGFGVALLQDSTRSVLEQVQSLVDEEFDIIAAEELLNDLQASLQERDDGEAEWELITGLDLYQRFSSSLDLFHQVGLKCCDQTRDWFTVYKDSTGAHTISGCFDEQCSRLFHYRARVIFPASLPKVLAVANEVELGPLWQPALVGKPEVLGQRTACRLVVHSQMSLVGGMFKVDTLNDVKRYVHRQGGFLAEYIQSADEQHPHFCEPRSGFRRLDTEVANMWVSCGPDHTMLIQVGKLKLPFSVTRWVVNSIGSLVGSKILSSLTRNALRAAEPGSPWERPLQDDRLGIYRLLAGCAQAPKSLERTPSEAAGALPQVGLAELQRFFRKAPAPKEP